MFSSIGIPELMVVLVIVMLLFGAKRLPELGSSMGRAIKEFKTGMNAPIQAADTAAVATPTPEVVMTTAPDAQVQVPARETNTV